MTTALFINNFTTTSVTKSCTDKIKEHLQVGKNKGGKKGDDENKILIQAKVKGC